MLRSPVLPAWPCSFAVAVVAAAVAPAGSVYAMRNGEVAGSKASTMEVEPASATDPDEVELDPLDSESELEQLEQGTRSPWWRDVEWSIDADVESSTELQGEESASELTFDEVAIALEGDRWLAEVSIKYESEGRRGLLVEEAAVRLGGTEDQSWYVQAGRTFVPFGFCESRFIEDPLTATVGETDRDALSVGLRGGPFAVELGGYRGKHATDGDLDLAVTGKLEAADEWTVGLSWSRDLGEAAELEELRADYLEEEAGSTGNRTLDAPGARRVEGLAAFLVHEGVRTFVHLEWVGATSSFTAAQLDEVSLRPRAWNLEAGLRPRARWELATRLEASRELPEAPRQQIGAAVSYAWRDGVTMTVEYLRGAFEGEADRNLFGAKMGLEF